MTRPDTETSAKSLSALRHSFGAATVTPDQRQTFVRDLFDRVAPRYDLMNDLMSFGLHRGWKRAVARAAVAAAQERDGDIIDLAGGTGDLAALMVKALPQRRIIIADASGGMLAVARRRLGETVAYVEAPAEALPLADASAAVVTLSFGLRNMTDPQAALREVHRILKPGGHLLLMEFSQAAAWFRPAYAVHSRLVIPALGAMVAGNRGAYRYLVDSIRRFPDAESLTQELNGAGFGPVAVRRFMFGVAALHSARKM
jgi:demethylmenaquinone methyltransferase/2-methoxy-6-polyprenyl-1,4-benzoquinol methylase